MAGLLNMVPRYLPRYGMAPDWARAVRPLVLVFTAIAFLVTWLFEADVDAQGGAYATGVLVLITSAAVAVTLVGPRGRAAPAATVAFARDHAGLRLHDRRQRRRAAGRREDRRAASSPRIVAVSLVSRLSAVVRAARRPTYASTTTAELFVARLRPPHDPAGRQRARRAATARSTTRSCARSARDHDLPDDADVIFVEVTVTDPSDFETRARRARRGAARRATGC